MFLEHVNMSVSDLDQTIDFYQRVFGLGVRWRGTTATGEPAAHIGDAHFYLALFEVEDRGPEPPNYGQLGLNHLGFVVEDLDAVKQQLAALNVQPHLEADYELGRRLYFIDPNGVEVELVEYEQVHVSNNGGIDPVWSRDDGELFYAEPGNPPRLISVSVTTDETSQRFAFGNRVPVVDLPDLIGEGRSYDVSPDGQRFLVLRVASGETTGDAEINVVLNWHQELLERVPIP